MVPFIFKLKKHVILGKISCISGLIVMRPHQQKCKNTKLQYMKMSWKISV